MADKLYHSSQQTYSSNKTQTNLHLKTTTNQSPFYYGRYYPQYVITKHLKKFNA